LLHCLVEQSLSVILFIGFVYSHFMRSIYQISHAEMKPPTVTNFCVLCVRCVSYRVLHIPKGGWKFRFSGKTEWRHQPIAIVTQHYEATFAGNTDDDALPSYRAFAGGGRSVYRICCYFLHIRSLCW
jgi:hypothetical protein